MFGLADLGVSLAFGLTILSAGACVVYGIVNWNLPREDMDAEVKEEMEWERRDPELNEGESE